MLLYALAQATSGFYFAATEATEAESLRRLGQAVADHIGAPAPLQLASWEHAIDVLLGIGRERPPWPFWTSSPISPRPAARCRR